jgi:glycosyltransferase involved in cell wall biosynthesis
VDNLPEQAVMLMITSQDWGGAQLYIFELACELKKRGDKVIVCAGKQHGSVLGDLDVRCRERQIPFIELQNMVRDINPIANILSVFELARLFRKLKPRVVHLNSTMMGATGSLAATLARVPRRIYCIGGWVFNEDLPRWKKSLYIFIEKLSAKWKDIIIVVHPGDEELAKKLHIQPVKKLVTIPNGVGVNIFEKKLLSREDARAQLGIHSDANIVGTIANAYAPKNLLWYLEVCEKVHEMDPRIHFVIIGDGPQFESLKNKNQEIGTEKFVLLTGRRMDAPALYKAFDLFTLPSSKEGMSITLLEAMASKVPIVATDVGAAKWMLGDAAQIVESGNLDEMSSAIVDLVNDAQKQKSISAKAYEMLCSRFDLKTTLDKTIDLIG